MIGSGVRADVVVVGAGPAGMTAATAAAESGCSVVLLDDQASAGGQIWRAGLLRGPGMATTGKNEARERALERLAASGARVRAGFSVFDAPARGRLRAVRETEGGAEVLEVRYHQLILATGARELLLPFPGWTLPGVFGAGGLQALVQGGFDVRGKRVAVAGSGPLLLAVAAHLAEDGAKVVSVSEQAPMGQMLPFAMALGIEPGKLWQGLRYRAAIWGARYRTGCWPVAAVARDGVLGAVRLTTGKKTWEEPCDLLACGFHLTPNTELAKLLGCAVKGGYVAVDERQRSSIPGVYCAGEPTGIAGVDGTVVQGEIAGLAAAGRATEHLETRRVACAMFAARMAEAFRLRAELRKLAEADTIVCRCEDVRFAELAARQGWTEAKLQTRCGMGACQGRICGPATEVLFGWEPRSVRPPLTPVPLRGLVGRAASGKEG